MELPVSEEDPALEIQAFAATEAGKCSATIGDIVGGEALDKQVVQYIADSAAACNMTPDADGLTNYRECSRPLGLAAGSMVDTACATIAPGKAKAPTTPTDINILHCTFGHTREVLLKKTATQQGIAYSGELHECRGCSMAKGLRKPIARSTHTRADKKLQRVFVDLSGPMAVQSIGGKRYTLIVRDDCTRFTRVNFFMHKSDAASAFESFLAEVRADGTPSAVMAVRSDNGREFFGGASGELCRKRGIKQEFTPADSPKYNSVAERALGLINDAAVAARIQATELYPNAPNYPSLWAEAASWACHALNCTATTANPGDKSPYEMWYGSHSPRGAVWPFLKPAVCRVKRANA